MHRSYETQYTFWTYTVAAHCYAAAHYYVVCGFWSVPAHVARVCVLVCVRLCHQQGFRLILSYLGMTVVKSAGNSLSVSPSYTRTFSCLLCPAGMSGDTEVRENRDSLVFFCLLPPSLLPSLCLLLLVLLSVFQTSCLIEWSQLPKQLTKRPSSKWTNTICTFKPLWCKQSGDDNKKNTKIKSKQQPTNNHVKFVKHKVFILPDFCIFTFGYWLKPDV